MTLARADFERALRSLDGGEARSFVVDLLEARGYRTTVEGGTVRATDGSGASIRLLVVADGRSLASATRHRRLDAVVVTGGPVASVVGSVARRTVRQDDRPDLLGTETLYEWFAFAVDSDARATLEARYLGATDPTALSRGLGALGDGFRSVASPLRRLPTPLRGSVWGVVVVLVALVVLVAATAVGPFGLAVPFWPAPNADEPELTPSGVPTSVPGTATPVPVSVTPDSTRTASGRPLPDVCPPAPIGAHPSSLRPTVRQTATAAGLDGWRVLVTQNLTEYQFDPNDQQAGIVPEVRHVAVFERPGGAQLRLGLERWGSPALAERAVARGGPWGVGLPWGAYTLWVEWEPDDTGGETAARHLLAAVTTPDGIRLGGSCVTALAPPSTNGTA